MYRRRQETWIRDDHFLDTAGCRVAGGDGARILHEHGMHGRQPIENLRHHRLRIGHQRGDRRPQQGLEV